MGLGPGWRRISMRACLSKRMRAGASLADGAWTLHSNRMAIWKRVGAIAGSLHWSKGLRAGFAVASAMLVCRALGRPMGWAALGGFEAVLVDNGGPYRSRLDTVSAVLLGGAACGLLGSLIPS